MFLVAAAVAQHQKGNEAFIKPIIILYLIGTFCRRRRGGSGQHGVSRTHRIGGCGRGIQCAAFRYCGGFEIPADEFGCHPINAIANANYIGILAWALVLGAALRNHGSDVTRQVVADLAEAVSTVVKWIIRFAPLGIFGLVSSTIAETGFGALSGYVKLLAVLLGCMVFIALVVNPVIVWWKIRSNPYPLVFTCLRESGVYASLPVLLPPIFLSIWLWRKSWVCMKILIRFPFLWAQPSIWRVRRLRLPCWQCRPRYTQGIHVDFATALLLSLVATVSACGASGVAGGSLLLVPLACSLFGINNDVAMQVVAVGFIIGVIQDSAETALNSSTDVLFTAAADMGRQRK